MQAISIALNIIQKQQAEDENKDKMIDLIIKTWKQDDVRTVEEIKQYFAKQMRKIKFRGKDLLGKWRYGDLVQEKWKSDLNTNEKAYMIKKDKRAWSVLEETIGQYTGLKDKTEKEIYEGDIVTEGEYKGQVIFDEKYLGFFVNFTNEEQEPLYDVPCLEVIGNIYDNPELLERK